MNKNTTVPDHAIGDFKDDVRSFLFHAKIAGIYARAMMRNRAMGYLFQGNGLVRIIVTNAQRLLDLVQLIERRYKELKPENYIEDAIITGLTEGTDVYGDKLNNIAVATSMIHSSKKDYTARLDFAFNSSRQREILRKYWIAAKGSDAGFDEFHNCSKELKRGFQNTSLEVAG